MTKNTIRETLTGIGAALVTSAFLCIAVDLFRAGLVLFLLGCAFACPVKHRLAVGVAGVFAALVLIVAWATSMNQDREFAATYLSVFVIFMLGTGLSRAARRCEDSSCA